MEAHATDPQREAIAARIAWSAVKRSYIKIGDDWIPRSAFAWRDR